MLILFNVSKLFVQSRVTRCKSRRHGRLLSLRRGDVTGLAVGFEALKIALRHDASFFAENRLELRKGAPTLSMCTRS